MISVCMATFNGELTIERQLFSIVKQLGSEDEIIIVDDGSSDKTILLADQLLKASIVPYRILINPHNVGPIRSFERALENAKGSHIYLSDQDDEWYSNKIAVCESTFSNDSAELIVHDAAVVDGNLNIIDPSWNHYNHNHPEQGVAGNLYKNAYTGAMMAFTNQLKNLALPFPKTIAMHDQWLFLVAKSYQKNIVVLNQPLMNYVRHGNNVTGTKRNILPMIKDRIIMIHRYINLLRKSHIDHR